MDITVRIFLESELMRMRPAAAVHSHADAAVPSFTRCAKRHTPEGKLCKGEIWAPENPRVNLRPKAIIPS